jgi:hypothetical protein
MMVPESLLGRRAALTALAAACLIAIFGIGLVFLLLVAGARSEAQDNLADLGRFRAEVASRPLVEHALAIVRSQASSHPAFLHGDSDALVQASLQSDVKAMVEAAGGEVRSAFVLPPTPDHGLDLVSVQYDLMLPVTRLHDLAYAIETHTPYLFVTAAELSAPQNWPTDPKAPEPELELRWTIAAYRWSPAP